MAKKHVVKDQATEVFENVEQRLTKAELFFENNRKPLLIGVGVILGVAMLYYGYKQFIQGPQEAEAQEMIFRAQKYLEQDSLKLALNGDGQNLGFLEVAEEYSWTKTGNLANYYAGICYLNMGQFEDAITYLDKFNGDDVMLSVISKGAIGDAFLELGQPEEALEYYSKAAKVNENEFVVPMYLMKAGQTAELINDFKKALTFYKRIQSDFPESREAAEIEKDIAYAEAKAAQ
jgi:tetratricopeptide (TPR) repeat protein